MVRGGIEVGVVALGRAMAPDAVNCDGPHSSSQVTNTHQVIEEVRTQSSRDGTRYFSFGIGSGVSSGLVKGIAEAGKGEAVFIVSTQERMAGKIMQQMGKALIAPMTGASIMWGPIRLVREPSPRQLPPLFPDTRVMIFAVADTLSLPQASDSITVTLGAQTPDGVFSVVSNSTFLYDDDDACSDVD